MAQRPTLTTEAGAPVIDNQNSQTAGVSGPVLLQDHYLIEKLARFNRERIPERVVHAVGSGAHGYLEVTSEDVPLWTRMKVFSAAGKRTPVFIRFSTVAGSRGAADTARDPRGFALKVYTEDGNWDLVGNNTPVFFIRDGIKFPDFIHSQKYDPFTNRQEPNNVWDFFSHSPEATHQFTWLFGGERCWVKFHFKTNQGIRGSLQDHLGCQRSLQFSVRRLAGAPRCLTNHVLPEMASPLPHSGRRGSLTDRSVKCVDTTKH